MEKRYGTWWAGRSEDEMVLAVREEQHDLIEARESLAASEQAFQGAVEAALAHGVPAARLAESLGLSRARIYQIRDGKR